MGIDQPAPDDVGDGAADRGDRGLDGGPSGPPNVSRAEQIAAHFRNRESVEAAYRAAADRDAWAAAAPRLRAEWEEHKQRYPERVRASPHTNPDGSWACGPHRRLDPEQNTEAGKAHADLADEAGTGLRFEMQFHTPESLEAKELTHGAYERLRRPEAETSQVERDELEDFQRRANAVVARPPRTDTIKDFPEKKR